MSASNAAEQGAANVLVAFSERLAEAVERAGTAVARVDGRGPRRGRGGSASGIVWTADGLVLTADHVLERDEDLAVSLPDGRSVGATIVARDPGTDLALLRAQAQGLAPIERGPLPKVGHVVLVVARPGNTLATSIGVVSALGGPVRTWHGGRLNGVIWTDATFYPGFSGAPLVDAAGRMVGLATSQFGRGTGLAIPLETVERVTTALLSHGRMRRGYLGVSSQVVALPETMRRQHSLAQESGLLVVGVEPGAPADRGGLLLGDVIVGLGGQPVRDTDDLLSLLGPERVGQPAPVQVIRGGERRDLTVTIGERT